MKNEKISKDEALENAIKFSTRPQPLCLCSKLNEDILALTLISGRKIFFLKEAHTYLPSLLVHEFTEASLASQGVISDLAFCGDLLKIIGCKSLPTSIIINDTKFIIVRKPIQDFLDGKWHSVLDAGALYSQLHHQYTPPDFSNMVLEDLKVHNKETASIYNDIHEIAKKFRVKCSKNLFDEMDAIGWHNKPPNVKLKDLILTQIFRATTSAKEVKAKIKVLSELSEHEIPKFCTLKGILDFIDEVFTRAKMSSFLLCRGESLASQLIPITWLIWDDVTNLNNFFFGLFNEFYTLSLVDYRYFPLIGCICNDLTRPFEAPLPLFCIPPLNKRNVKTEILHLYEVQDVDWKKITSIERNADIGKQARIVGYGTLLCIENARQQALKACRTCPLKKGKIIQFIKEGNSCKMLQEFLIETKKRTRKLRNCIRNQIKKHESAEPCFSLPLYSNLILLTKSSTQ